MGVPKPVILYVYCFAGRSTYMFMYRPWGVTFMFLYLSVWGRWADGVAWDLDGVFISALGFELIESAMEGREDGI